MSDTTEGADVPLGEAEPAGAHLRKRLLRFGISICILAFVISQLDTESFFSHFGNLHIGKAIFAFLVGLSLVMMAAYRWYWLVGPTLNRPFSVFMRLTFIGAFAGLFLPGTIGNEAVRVVGLARAGSQMAVAAASIVVDRVLSMFAQFLLALGLIAFAPAGIPSDLTLYAVLGLLVLVAGIGFLMNRKSRNLLRRFMNIGPLKRLSGITDQVFEALDAYRDRKLMVGAMALAIIFQLQRALFLWSCAVALGLGIGVFPLLIALPVVSVIELAPVTFAGIGTREAAFAVTLSYFGIEPADAVAMSLLAFFLGTVIASLPGAYYFARHGLAGPVKR